MLPQPTPPTAPAPEVTTERQPIKRDFYDLDNLIKDLNTPKEQIQQSRPAQIGQPGQAPQFGTGIGDQLIDSPEIEPIPADVALLSGKAIAGTIDTVVATGLSLYAKAASPEKSRHWQKVNLRRRPSGFTMNLPRLPSGDRRLS